MLRADTVGLDESSPASRLPLLELLDAVGRAFPEVDRLAFVNDGEGVVGWGVAARIAVPPGPGRLDAVRERVAELLAADGAEAIVFASFTFDPDEEGSVVVVPSTTVVRRDGRTSVTSVTSVGSIVDGRAADPASDVERLLSGRTGSASRPEPDRPRYAGSTLRDDRWLEAVARALEAIDQGVLQKVVLARDLEVWSRTPFDLDAVLQVLAERFPSCFTFLVDGLLGASPELLLSRRSDVVRSRVLAGTARRDADAATDAAIGAELLRSAKDRHEHDLARTSVLEVLGPFCTTIDAPTEPTLIRLENVQHLGTDLVGRLAVDTHVLTVLEHLHPTAAVAGTPREAAVAAIRSVEGMSRGRYAGPVGWFTPAGDGEFAIALRCGQFEGSRARLFAGAGIVEGSLPELELAETWLKLRAMMGALGEA